MSSNRLSLLMMLAVLAGASLCSYVNAHQDAQAATLSKHGKKRAATCGDNQDEKACLKGSKEGDCGWCQGGIFSDGKCLSATAAKYIPDVVSKCEVPKPDSSAQAANVVASCDDNLDRKSCLKGSEQGGCGWCQGGIFPDGRCLSTTTAKLIPDIVAKCEVPEPPSVGKKHDKKDKKETAAKCGDNNKEKACLRGSEQGDCAWCSGGYIPDGKCVAAVAAHFIPDMVATCRLRKDKDISENVVSKVAAAAAAVAVGSCGDNQDKIACLSAKEGKSACAWCAGKYMGKGKCMSAAGAKWMPSEFAEECSTAPDEAAAVPATLTKAAPATPSCGDNTDKHACLADSEGTSACAWCSGKYLGKGKCMSEAAAAWAGEFADHCSFAKKESDDGSVVKAVAPSNPSGGDWPAAGGCMSLKSKKECLKGGDGSQECAWCENDYMGASCLTESAAKYMPSFAAKCKLPKHKGNGEAVVKSL